MELEFEIAKTDYKSFHKQHFINELRKSITVIIVISLIIGYSFSGQPFDWMKFILVTIISGFLYLTIFYFIPYFFSLFKLSKAIAEEPGYLDKKRLSISDDGLHIETATKNSIWKWESIVSVNSHEEFILLRLADKSVYLIPKTAFISDNERINFLGIIQCNITKVRGLNNTFNKKKPPYKWGLICLIPIVGVYAGILFILQGIFKYKDKWFTLIGVFGILFTVILYGTLFPELWNEKVKNEKNAECAENFMNNLVKDIEFYRIQHGKYPESLDVFDNSKIIDLTQDIESKNKKFNYKLVGDKYLLFSSGIDRIPNTNDDLYPNINVNDSSKVGYLKKHFR